MNQNCEAKAPRNPAEAERRQRAQAGAESAPVGHGEIQRQHEALKGQPPRPASLSHARGNRRHRARAPHRESRWPKGRTGRLPRAPSAIGCRPPRVKLPGWCDIVITPPPVPIAIAATSATVDRIAEKRSGAEYGDLDRFRLDIGGHDGEGAHAHRCQHERGRHRSGSMRPWRRN